MTLPDPQPATVRKILVVDDAVTVRLYHRQLLETLGCEVAEAENGVEALEKVAVTDYDLLLVDVNMPKMDGYRLISEVRSQPRLAALPAIMISTEAGSQDQQKAFSVGANFYLVKPVEPARLQQLVALLLHLPAAH